MTRRLQSTRRAHLLAAMTLAAALAACGGGGSATGGAAGPAANPAGGPAPGSAQQVEARVGTATVHAVAMQTSTIPESVAREHGIERRDGLVMLMVSPRRGPAGSVESVPMTVRATATGMQGRVQPMEMREVRPNGLLDYVGTVPVEMPDTVRFEIQVTSPEGARETLRLTRDFRAP